MRDKRYHLTLTYDEAKRIECIPGMGRLWMAYRSDLAMYDARLDEEQWARYQMEKEFNRDGKNIGRNAAYSDLQRAHASFSPPNV